MKSRVYIGSDHAGFYTKEKTKSYLMSRGFEVKDVGAFELNKEDDYPDFAFKLGEKVIRDKGAKGILICGSGEGMAIAANKVKGIRAAAVYDSYSAKMSRQDNDTNVLALNGRKFSFTKVKKIVDIWLFTEFSNLPRHKRRIKKIAQYENDK